jgi:hypothetical protein
MRVELEKHAARMRYLNSYEQLRRLERSGASRSQLQAFYEQVARDKNLAYSKYSKTPAGTDGLFKK